MSQNVSQDTYTNCTAQGYTKIDCNTDLTGADLGVQDDLEVKDTGFFSYLGSLANRITKLFVQDIDASGSVNVSGNITSPQYKSIDAGEIKTGLTSSKFRVCDKFKVSDNTCEEWCKLEITGGIITACK